VNSHEIPLSLFRALFCNQYVFDLSVRSESGNREKKLQGRCCSSRENGKLSSSSASVVAVKLGIEKVNLRSLRNPQPLVARGEA
jgi:hypothetical protein